MTAPIVAECLVDPEVAWRGAEKGLRVSEDAKRVALIYAAQQCNEHFKWLTDQRFTVVKSLMRTGLPGDEFGSLIVAVHDSNSSVIREVLDRLVGGS